MVVLHIRRVFILALFAFLLALTGCGGGGFAVTGKVTFPDGSPLDTGTVVFDSGSTVFYGGVDKQGNYTMMGTEGSKGIPAGSYQIYLMGTVRSPYADAEPIPTDADGNQIGPPRPELPDIQLVANKFLQKGTSGLQCDVKGKTEFNIPVEKP